MEKLKEVLDLMPAAKRSLGLAAKERVNALKKLRKKMVDEGFDPGAVDEEFELLKGTKDTKGLFHALEVQEEQQAKPDPLQKDLEDKPDYRTHSLNAQALRELVAAEVSANPPAGAIIILNGLEDGEKEKEPKPRESHLKIIRDARAPLVKMVEPGIEGVAH